MTRERRIIRFDEQATAAELGGKAAALRALQQTGLPIPPWLVITPAAFAACLSAAQRRDLAATQDPDPVAAILNDIDPGQRIRGELDEALRSLGLREQMVAVRSSAAEEDGGEHSFAGQFESHLAVPPERVIDRVVDVWRSGLTPRVLAYRRERGITADDDWRSVPSVLVQQFVDAEVSGVAFGADPVTGRRSVTVVAAVFGLGTALVGGDQDADTWHIDRGDTIIQRQIVRKPTRHAADPDASSGVREQPVAPAQQHAPALTDEQAVAIAAMARRAGRHFGAPQDIEWAWHDGRAVLLQSRPITSLRGLPDPEGRLQLWDNANIAESYSGITTPLTFSFARRAYEGVYREFCLLLRVDRATVDDQADVFANMLGLLRGRVYYNLLNWYRMLALLPGFASNRRFMEQMMGVSRSLPDALLAQVNPPRHDAAWRDRLRVARVGGAMAREHLRLPRTINAFYQRLNTALREPSPPLAELRLDELAVEYTRLERALISRWDAPLVNDLLAMIFFGVLRSAAARWGDDASGQLHNHLLCAEGGIVSAEPAQRIRAMADLARKNPALVATLCEAPPAEALSAILADEQLGPLFEAYRERFGDRCLGELKLESLTLDDDPTPLLRSIGYAARRPAPDEAPGNADRALREQAEQHMAKALRGHPLRRVLYRWVLKHARRRVRDRENLRFERTRLFGRVRRIFIEMGRRLTAEGVLADARDVFYLEVDELIGFVQGTATCTDLSGLVGVRRAEFEAHAAEPAPADRVSTRGAVPIGNALMATEESAADQTEDETADGELRGVGACPGIVRGTVRVIRDPRGIELPAGTIVVAQRTDPGWIMLLPAAAGMLVQHGSLLSHSAIVSRELGVPSIVSIPHVTDRLQDGQLIEMDGQRGTVRLITSDAEDDHAD